MFQPQWYPKERKTVGEGGRKILIYFFFSRHLIYSVTLMLINNA